MSFEALKKSIDANDADTSSILLADIFLQDPNDFKKSLLLSNSLPEPLERDFDDKNLETLIQAFILAGKNIALWVSLKKCRHLNMASTRTVVVYTVLAC